MTHSPTVNRDWPYAYQLGASILFDLALNQQVAGLSCGSVLATKAAVLDDAGELPGVALCVPFRRTCQLREPMSIKSLSCNQYSGDEHKCANHK